MLEADYTVALQRLLKYPAPEAPHGPHTFVDDALYLRGHLSPAGGSTLILKYTGRAPAPAPTSPPIVDSRPSTPSSLGLHLRQRTLGAKSPLSTSAKFLQTPAGMEALFQGAAKGVLERGEKLGINQAVRDAVGEIRRNVQGLQEARTPGRSTPRDPFDANNQTQSSFALAVLERRERQLAAMLEETVTNLRNVANSGLDGDKAKHIEAIEVAAAKVQFVRVHLEDSSLALPEEDMPAISALAISAPEDGRRPTVALDTTPVVMASSAVETVRSTLSSPDSAVQNGPTSPPPPNPAQSASTPLPVVQELSQDDHPDKMDTDMPLPQPSPDPNPSTTHAPTSTSEPLPNRPPPVPTRSTIAHSSFSWMLEPDSAPAGPVSSNPSPPTSGAGQGQQQHKKRPSSGRRNDRNAFLFGEVVSSESEGEGALRVREGEIFGLKSMK